MQLFRSALRRQARCNVIHPTWYRRGQHDVHGPHKEYFQRPGQTPLPDAATYIHPQTPPVVPGPSGPPRIIRAARSLFWASLFSAFGLIAGTALITWEYMQPPFEQGSQEDQELFEEIVDTLENHPLVESLREEKWIEDNFYSGRLIGAGKGLHLVAERLSGTQGITMKTFRHPSQEYTMMVFFLGFGIEGWPDVIHGGIITTLLQEGVDQHIQNFYAKNGNPQGQMISIDFKKPVRPGDIYAILIPPGASELHPLPHQKHIQLVSILMHMEAAPRVQSTFDAASNTDQHTIEIPTSGSGDTTHAIATVRVRLVDDVKNLDQDASNRQDDDRP